MPVDVRPVPTGNIVIIDNVAHVLKKGEQPEGNVRRYVSHFVTCPERDQHRRR